MHGLAVEYCTANGSLSRDLVQRLSGGDTGGKVAIVAENPVASLAAARKQWVKLTRRTQRDRSATLNATTIAELTQRIARMQATRFSAKPPDDLLEADITFATAEDFVKFPPTCSAVYVTYKFDKEKLHMLTSWMQRSGRVIIYE
jgi:hypothetical protein